MRMFANVVRVSIQMYELYIENCITSAIAIEKIYEGRSVSGSQKAVIKTIRDKSVSLFSGSRAYLHLVTTPRKVWRQDAF